MEKVLDIISNAAVFVFIGYMFYAMHKMQQKDKEFAKHEKN